MNRAIWMTIVLASVLAVPVGTAEAQPPDVLRHYRFLPRHSILSVEGGFPGFDIDANIRGTFDFATGFRQNFPHLERYAQFLNVDAEGINPTDFGPYSFDLEETLNLSGLEGRFGRHGLHWDNWVFTGVEGQGAPIRIHVVEIGRWLAIFGRNAPLPNTADYFEYGIRAIARQRPFADFNLDDVVDRHDLAAWAGDFGGNASGSSSLTEGGTMGGDDFLLWQQQNGETPPDLDAVEAQVNASANTAVVPEPTGLAMLAGGLLLVLTRRRA